MFIIDQCKIKQKIEKTEKSDRKCKTCRKLSCMYNENEKRK